MATPIRSAEKTSRTSPRTIAAALDRGDFSAFAERLWSEAELRAAAETIRSSASFGAIYRLIDSLPGRTDLYDRNVARLLWFFDIGLVIESLRHAGSSAERLRESAGLAWVLGESGRRDGIIIEHLTDVVRRAVSGRAWWFAAWSLEKLGAGDAVNLMKRSLVLGGTEDLKTHLRNLSDYRSIIGILLTASDRELTTSVPRRLTAVLTRSKNPIELANCAWLCGRLRLSGETITDRLAALVRHERESIRHAALGALCEISSERQRPIFEAALLTGTRQIKTLAAEGLLRLGGGQSIAALTAALEAETDQLTVAAVSAALVTLRDPAGRERLRLEKNMPLNECGALLYPDRATTELTTDRAAFLNAVDPDGISLGLAATFSKKEKRRGLIQIGWDETVDDDLAFIRFTYLHEGDTWSFDDWRAKTRESAATNQAENGHWLKRGLRLPLRFGSLAEAVAVMGRLFGRDAAREIIRSGKTEWTLSLGLTRDIKKSLGHVLFQSVKR